MGRVERQAPRGPGCTRDAGARRSWDGGLMIPDLRPNEDVVAHARQHWSRPLGRAVAPLLLLVAVIVVALSFRAVPPAWPAPWPTVGTIGLIILGALACLWFAWIYLDWVDDALIVTNQRVIWLQKTAFFNERRREIPLHRVQDISVNVDGLLPNWLGYGTLLVEAAGSPPIIATALMRPNIVRERIFATQGEIRATRLEAAETGTEAAVRAALGLAPAGQPTAEVPVLPATTEAAGSFIIWRRHWWFLFKAILRPLLLLALAIAAAVLSARLTVLPPEVVALLPFLLAAFGLVGLVAALWQYLVWREDRYVLDGDRLRDVEQAPFRLRRLVKETTLARVQDVSYTIPHPLAHLLNYGDVLIQTAGESQQFTFDGVADPRAVHAEISRRLSAGREAEGEARSQQQREEILDILRAYHDINQEQAGGQTPPPPPAAPPPPPAPGPRP